MKIIFIEHSAIRKDKNGSNPPCNYFSPVCFTIYILEDWLSEKKSSASENGINLSSVGAAVAADDKFERNDSWLPMG